MGILGASRRSRASTDLSKQLDGLWASWTQQRMHCEFAVLLYRLQVRPMAPDAVKNQHSSLAPHRSLAPPTSVPLLEARRSGRTSSGRRRHNEVASQTDPSYFRSSGGPSLVALKSSDTLGRLYCSVSRSRRRGGDEITYKDNLLQHCRDDRENLYLEQGRRRRPRQLSASSKSVSCKRSSYMRVIRLNPGSRLGGDYLKYGLAL